MRNQENDNNDNNKISGVIFAGFMFIGIGIGMAMNNAVVGTLVGMGAGFLAYAIYNSEKNK